MLLSYSTRVDLINYVNYYKLVINLKAYSFISKDLIVVI